MRVGARTRCLVPVVLGWLILAAGPASAKVPPFTVEVKPDPPVAGRTTVISVVDTFDTSFPLDELPGLLALYRQQDVESRRRGIPIALERTGTTRYRAEVLIPEVGRWVLVAFPDRSGWGTRGVPPGYPDTIELEVGPAPPDHGPDKGLVLSALLLAFLTVMAHRIVRSRRGDGPHRPGSRRSPEQPPVTYPGRGTR